LLRHPDQLQLVRDNPSLLAPAVEELMRYDGAVQMRGLGIAEGCEIGGKRLRRGQTALLMLGAANRDPRRFSEADRLDVTRSDARHLDFGRGIHFCIAAALARAEIHIVIETILRRMPRMRLSTEALEWQTVPVFRGLTALPLEFGADPWDGACPERDETP
jgi:cytochrome P450